MRINTFLIGALSTAGLAMGLAAAPASAFPISPQTCGQWTVDPALSCFPGVGQNDTADDVGTLYPRPDAWEFIDKDDELVGDTEPGPGWSESDFFLTDADGNLFTPGADTSGYFYISNAVLAAFDELVLTTKGGDADPRWAAFLLDLGSLVVGSGDYAGYRYGAWQSGQGLSHASLWGNGTGVVPEPGSLALLGLGLAGLGMARRRKTA